MLTIIMGKTCSGKTTIVNELKKYGFQEIQTYTTRPARKGDTYHFISESEFLEKIQQNFFAEYKKYNRAMGTWYYGSARVDIENSGDNDVVILTPSGYKDVVREYPELQYRLIYIYANRNTIKKRLLKRGDKKEEADQRIKQDDEDFKGVENLADKIFYNNEGDDLNSVVKKIRKYLEVCK